MDIRQTDLYANYLKSLGWTIEKTSFGNIFIKKILFFSVIKIQRTQSLNEPELKKIIKKYRAIYVNYEPAVAGQSPAIGAKGQSLLPTKTIVLDLGNTILPKDTRYEIRKAQDNKLETKVSTDIEMFYELLKETMKIGGWQIPIKNEVLSLYKSFQPNNCAILITRYLANPLAISGSLIIWSHDTAHYMYAANNKTGLELGGAYFTLNESIKFCQKLGLKYLDLEGIYDERFPNKSWIGFTKFKLGWNGKIVEFPLPKRL